ncbi:MAG: hypothetical protein DHS80DRAFT_22965 [Piptocephalis tieghemiana]|nr:MAG: hypothetical protein DHS80DRAFT_22965 [Piptocephalis tieghemiana]
MLFLSLSLFLFLSLTPSLFFFANIPHPHPSSLRKRSYDHISGGITKVPSIMDMPSHLQESDGSRARTGGVGVKTSSTPASTPAPRYDVDIVTKICVYSGIGWLAASFIPTLFHWMVLGP